jgi:hypothetical protein
LIGLEFGTLLEIRTLTFNASKASASVEVGLEKYKEKTSLAREAQAITIIYTQVSLAV